MCNSVLDDFARLLRINFLKSKGVIKFLLSDPISAIKVVKDIIFAFGFIGFFIISGARSYAKNPNDNFFVMIFNSGIVDLVIMIAVFLYIVIKFLNSEISFNTSYFKSSDINYLFPSPINERVIMTYCLLRETIKNIFYFMLFFIFICIICKVSILKFFIASIGYALLTLSFSGVNYLIFSLKVRFNCIKLINSFKFLFIVGIFTFIGHKIIFNLSIFNRFHTYMEYADFIKINILDRVPLISTIKEFILYPYKNSSLTYSSFIILALISLIINGLAIYFGVDYYEEVSEGVLEFNDVIKDIKTSKKSDETLKDKKFSKYFLKSSNDVFNKLKFKGSGAFIYKANIYFKRFSGRKKVIICTSLFTVISIVIRVFTRRISVINEPLLFNGVMLLFVYLYSNISGSSANIIEHDMDKSYLFLLPGDIITKILYVGFYNIIAHTLMLIPMIVLVIANPAINFLQVILWIIFIILFSNLIFMENLLPKFISSKLKIGKSFFSSIFNYAVLFIGIIAVKNLYKAYGSITLCLLIGICCVFIFNLILIFIFNKLQYGIES